MAENIITGDDGEGLNIDVSKIVEKLSGSREFRKDIIYGIKRGIKDELREQLGDELHDQLGEELYELVKADIDKLLNDTYTQLEKTDITTKVGITQDISPQDNRSVEVAINAPVTAEVSIESPTKPKPTASVSPVQVAKEEKVNATLDAIEDAVNKTADNDDVAEIVNAIATQPLEIPKLSTIERGFIGARKLREKLFGSKIATEEDAQTRQGLIRLGNQMQMTQKLIESNSDVLREFASTNENVSKVLEVNTSETSKMIREKLLAGKEVFPEEARYLVKEMELITKGLKDVGIALDVHLPSVIDEFKTLISDNRIDLTTRRELVNNMKDIVKESTKDKEILGLIKEINTEQLNFTQEQVKTLSGIFDELSDKTQDIKVSRTLSELDRTMDALVLTDQEMAEFLGQKTKDGKTTKESLLSKGLGAIPEKGATRGIIDSALASIGLPGLVDQLGEAHDLFQTGKAVLGGAYKGTKSILSRVSTSKAKTAITKPVAAIARGTKSFVSKAADKTMAGVRGTRNLVSKATSATLAGVGSLLPTFPSQVDAGGGLLSKAPQALKMLGQVARKAGPIAAALFAGYDAVKGMTVDAERIAGKAPGEDISMFERVQAGVSSLVEGLSFGFLKAEEIYKMIDNFFTSSSEVVSRLGSQFKSMFFGEETTVKPTSMPTTTLPTLPTRGIELSASRDAEARLAMNKTAAAAGKDVKVTMQAPTQDRPSNRTSIIDDMGLQLMNANAVE